MCGICGYVTLSGQPASDDVIASFKKLMLAIDSRGGDATGMAYVNEGRLVIEKSPVKAPAFVDSKPFEFLKSRRPSIAIGHTRYATTGHQEFNRNNHPQVSLDKGMALVHNGVIFNHQSLTRNFKLTRKAEVDTEVIMRLIEMGEGALPDKIQSATPYLSGSFAVALLSVQEPNNLYLFRHSNPIQVVHIPELDVIMFASEDKHIRTSMPSLDPAEDYFRTWRDIGPVSLKENTLYQVTNGENRGVKVWDFEADTHYSGNQSLWSYDLDDEIDDEFVKGYGEWKRRRSGGFCDAGTGGWKSTSYGSTSTKSNTSYSYTAPKWTVNYECDTCHSKVQKISEKWRLKYAMPCIVGQCTGFLVAQTYSGEKELKF